MTYCCKLCDATINLKTKHKHLSSRDHKHLEYSFVIRYVVENPVINRLNEILKKYIYIHNEKYAVYQVRCVLKLSVNQYQRYMKDLI